MKTVQIRWDSELERYRLMFEYDKEFIDGLKEHIPGRFRSYDPVTKQWTVAELYFERLMDFLNDWGIEAAVITRDEVEDRRARQIAAHGDGSTETLALAFLKLVPHEAMVKAYRHAAMLLHPDRNGGDTARMSALNAVWERIQSEVYHA